MGRVSFSTNIALKGALRKISDQFSTMNSLGATMLSAQVFLILIMRLTLVFCSPVTTGPIRNIVDTADILFQDIPNDGDDVFRGVDLLQQSSAGDMLNVADKMDQTDAGKIMLETALPLTFDHPETAMHIADTSYPSEPSDASVPDVSNLEVKSTSHDGFEYYNINEDDLEVADSVSKNFTNTTDTANDIGTFTDSSEANNIISNDIANDNTDADIIIGDYPEENITTPEDDRNADIISDSTTPVYSEGNIVILNDAIDADDTAGHDSINADVTTYPPEAPQYQSCEVSELLRLKVASGIDAEGKRFYLARVDELQLRSAPVFVSDAIAAAASAAIAAATAPFLQLEEPVSANNVNADALVTGESAESGAALDDASSSNVFDPFDEGDGVVKSNMEENDISSADRLGQSENARRIVVKEIKLRKNDVSIDFFSLKANLITDADVTANSDSVDFDKNIYTSNDGVKLSNVKSDVGGTSDNDDNAANARGSADDSPRFIEVAVEETCGGSGNRLIVARVLSSAPAEESTTPAPVLEACPEELRDVVWRDRDGNSALHLASKDNLFECVDALVSAGIDLDARNKHSETALFLASWNGNTESLRRLIEAGADKEASIPGGWRPLHTAARNGREAAVQLLLASGVEVDPRSDDKSTPFWLAAYYNHGAVAKLLMEAGADPEAANWHGITVHKIARMRGSIHVANLVNTDTGEQDRRRKKYIFL